MARPVRMPKLMYRNALPADQSSLCPSPTSAPDSPTTDAPDQPPSTPTSAAGSIPSRPSFDSRSLTSSSLASHASTSKDSKAPKKKKAAAVLSFLSLKEPSQIAFEQYAEQQRKQAAEKGGPSSPVALSATTTQKLPASVPKVNSKWDGIPESLKSRDSTSTKSSRTSRSSKSSTPTPTPTVYDNYSVLSVATNASRGPPNSLASNSVSDVSAPLGNRRDSGSSLSELPEMTYFFPGAVDPSAPKDLYAPDGFLIEDEPSSPGSDAPREDSPSSSSTSVNVAANAIFQRLTSDEGFLAGEAQEVELPSGLAESHDFLFGPPPPPNQRPIGLVPRGAPAVGTSRESALNFSRPISVHSPLRLEPDQPEFTAPAPDAQHYGLPYRPILSGLSTVYEASIASTDTITDLADRRRSYEASIAPSVTPEMSASWYQSPRERLGLGGRLRKSDIIPWELQENRSKVSGKPKRGRFPVGFAKSN